MDMNYSTPGSSCKQLGMLVLPLLVLLATMVPRGEAGFQVHSSFLILPRYRHCSDSHNLVMDPLYSHSEGMERSSRSSTNHLSTSGRERREEDRRRLQRKNDVIIGKTSARKDAQNFEINTRATEESWMQSASQMEQRVSQFTSEGMKALRMLQLEEATSKFDQVFQLRPDAYLWQAGIAKFYLDELHDAADILGRNAIRFENKFGGPATEERIWRHACRLKLVSKLGKRKRAEHEQAVAEALPSLPESPEDMMEVRKVLRIARDLFDASVEKDYAKLILSRAKLRSIGGTFDNDASPGVTRARVDHKMWKLNAWFYLGLHYDALGEFTESKECMKMALNHAPNSGNGEDIMQILPLLHMSRRNWFDDDEFGTDPLDSLSTTKTSSTDEGEFSFTDTSKKGTMTAEKANSPTRGKEASALFHSNVDPLIKESIRASVEKMRLLELREALRVRGLSAHGSKMILKERFFSSLMSDTGL